jgi:hypothetical protein
MRKEREMKTDELNKMINNSVDLLFEEVKKGGSERLLDYLDFCSRFYKYSFYNVCLIYMQKRDAQKVAGFKAWNELGYKIKKGSKAIHILAPQKYTFIEVEGKRISFRNMTKEQKERKEEHKTGIYFVPAPVFDISQAEKGPDAPEVDSIFYNIGNNFKEKYINLKDIINKSGIKVTEGETGNSEGFSKGGEIVIKKKVDYNNKLLTLIHEWAHEILHYDRKNNFSRAEQEIQAEAISYIVSKYMGMNNPFSSDYILLWGKDKELLNNNLKYIVETARGMIKIINKDEELQERGRR